MGSHAAVAAELLGDKILVEKVLADYRSAPVSEAERALLAFVERVTRAAFDIRREDVDDARRAGWSEEALYDAIAVTALFNFYNRWCDAAGVHPFPDEYYRLAAKAMASRGYDVEL